MKALEAKNVSRKYGKQQVLKDFSLSLEAGEFVALMGPSGSGKSTFLHLAAGLLAVDSGEIAIGGKLISSMNDSAAAKFRRRHVGVVFQNFNLLAEKSVIDNIALPVKLDGGKPNVTQIGVLAGKLGIAEILNKKPTELSGGEQQRVAIARALFISPDVVLADEPTGNLDAKAAKATCQLLAELNESEKVAILMVTHDPQVAASAKKVAFLRDGAIAAIHDTNGDAERVSKLYIETYR